jgi:hypothetical protein
MPGYTGWQVSTTTLCWNKLLYPPFRDYEFDYCSLPIALPRKEQCTVYTVLYGRVAMYYIEMPTLSSSAGAWQLGMKKSMERMKKIINSH